MLALVGEHRSNAEIGARLFISVRTVETHVSSLLRKLGVLDRRALALVAGELARAERSSDALRATRVKSSRTTGSVSEPVGAGVGFLSRTRPRRPTHLHQGIRVT